MIIARGLRDTFAGRPVLLTEFGYATSEHEPAQAAIYESAAWLRAYDLGLAGAGKWMLWDLPPGPNPRERSFGLYDANQVAKPSALALPALSARLAPSRGPRGELEITATPSGTTAYRYRAEDALFASGSGRAGDGPARWEGSGWGQLFVDWAEPGAVHPHDGRGPGHATWKPCSDFPQPSGDARAVRQRLYAERRRPPWPHTCAALSSSCGRSRGRRSCCGWP